MEIFDKKFVHFLWDDSLDGKVGFVSNNVESIINNVNAGLEPAFALNEKEFKIWTFAYYDPNYEYKIAYAKGKAIQVREKYGSNVWQDCICEPTWEKNYEYRIKPEHEYRPFESLQELFEHWKLIVGCAAKPNSMPLIWIKSKNQGNSKIEFISGFNLDEDKVVIINTLYNIYSLEEMFENFTFLDGTPFGVVL